ncbi:hypothetical protein Gogos_021176, partial [Gossypium gossypioides]|nr:hypothetical protein [Gossypium gossypioides]
ISPNLLAFCYFFKQSSLFSQSGCLGRSFSTARRTELGTAPTSPIDIPNFKACNPACASVANGVAMLIIQSPQQKSRHCSFDPRLKTQGIRERYDYSPPPLGCTVDTEHQQLFFLSLD